MEIWGKLAPYVYRGEGVGCSHEVPFDLSTHILVLVPPPLALLYDKCVSGEQRV